MDDRAASTEVTVIHHGVDHDRFAPGGDDAEDLDALAAVGVVPPYIVFAGTLEPRKNIPGLIDAFALVAPRQPALQLVLAGGGGWGDAAVTHAITRSGVERRIVRTGYLRHVLVPALFRRAEVVAYPSFEEGFGLPALEALACGAPLVTTRGSSIEEFVDGAAVLAASPEPAALADALERGSIPRLPTCAGADRHRLHRSRGRRRSTRTSRPIATRWRSDRDPARGTGSRTAPRRRPGRHRSLRRRARHAAAGPRRRGRRLHRTPPTSTGRPGAARLWARARATP